MGCAREFLAILLSFISMCDASWFTINGDTTYEFSLCQRLGFYHATDYHAFLVLCGLAGWTKIKGGGGKKSLRIYIQPWTDLITEYDLDASRFHLTQTKLDLEAKIHGTVDGKRFYYQVIQIGKNDDLSYNSLSSQVVETTIPPNLNSLMSMQRSFTRNVRQMITDVIIDDPDVYKDATEDDDSTESEESEAEKDDDDKSMPDADAGSTTSTTSPLKSTRLFGQPTPSPSSTDAPKDMNEEFRPLTETLGINITGLLSSDFDTKIDALLAQVIALKQKRATMITY